MTRTSRQLFRTLAIVCALTCCRSRPAERAVGSAAPSGAAIPRASTTSSAAPSAAPSSQPSPARPDSLERKYAAALGRARKLQSEGKLAEASAAFSEATGQGEDVNLRALVELAYLDLTRGKLENVAELLLAGTTTGDPDLEAQAWFNLAVYYAKQKEAEAERSALARSLARREHAAVRAKLAGRSLCVAEVPSLSVDPRPTVLAGWPSVCAELGLCEKGGKVSVEEARKRSCLTSSGTATEPDQSHGCEDDGPWTSSFGYSLYSQNMAWIAPAGQGRFFVAWGREGSWPAICRGSASVSWEQVGSYARSLRQDEPLTSIPGRPVPQADPEKGVCVEGPATKTTAVFSLQTGKLLASVSVFPTHPVEVRLDEEAKRLVLSGGNCDGYVRLDGTMRLVQTH